jgi:hypothetical protein
VRAKGVLRKRESRADCVKRKPLPEVAIAVIGLRERSVAGEWSYAFGDIGERRGESVVGLMVGSQYGVLRDGVTARKNETTSAAHPPRNRILDVRDARVEQQEPQELLMFPSGTYTVFSRSHCVA